MLLAGEFFILSNTIISYLFAVFIYEWSMFDPSKHYTSRLP